MFNTRELNEAKSNVKNIWRYLLCKKKGVSSVDQRITNILNNKLRALYYAFGTSGKNCKVAQNFKVSLDEKTKII